MLTKHMRMKMYAMDIFTNVPGGLQVSLLPGLLFNAPYVLCIQ